MAAIVIGGPVSGIALSAALEARAFVVSSERSASLARYGVAQAMQGPYLAIFALMVAGTAAPALSFPEYVLRSSAGAIDSAVVLRFVVWPLDFFRGTSLLWMTPLNAAFLVDWVALPILANLLVVRTARTTSGGGGGGGESIIAGIEKWDWLVRACVVNLLLMPAPQVGYALYAFLDARAVANEPLLSCGRPVAPKHLPPAALAVWRSRQAEREGRDATAMH